MMEDEIQRMAADWIRHWSAKYLEERFETDWATSGALDLLFDKKFEDLWRLIVAIHALDQSPRIAELLSAGPIEDLLRAQGETFIERSRLKHELILHLHTF